MHAALVVAAAALWVLAVTLVAVAAPPDQRLDRALVEALIVGVPLATGLYAMRSRGTFRFGLLLTGAGAIWSLTALAESSDSLAYSVGRVSAWLIFPLLVYLTLAYPGGRLTSGLDRAVFRAMVALAALYVASALVVDAYPPHSPWSSCDADCPANAFLLLDSEPAVMDSFIAPVRELIAIVLLVGMTVSLGRRWRAATPLLRRMIGPVLVMSLVSAATFATFIITRRVAPDAAALDELGRIWSLTVPGVAAAFLVGLVRRRVVVGEVLGRLSLALSRRLDHRVLRAALAEADIELLVPDEMPGRWRDGEGRLRLEAPRGRRLETIEDDEGLAAALVHGPELDDEELLDAVRGLVLATVHHERLMTRLETSLSELDISRKRIARSADLERSRIERDLHDGAQQRLIGLRIKLSLAEELATSNPVVGAQVLHDLGADVELALEELRALAHGVYPSLLNDRGLKDALRSVLSGSSLPVRLAARGVTRQPPEIETGVYFACLEAVQNAMKHAHGATGLWVSLRQNHDLRFEVRDDGRGFELPIGQVNGGLGNMRDRVEAIGGQLVIESAPGQGTVIRGVVPLP